MKAFKEYHPLVCALYFLYFIVFTVVYRRPATVLTAFLCAFMSAAVLSGKKAVFFNLRFILPVFLVSAILNPLINHEGATIIYYFKNGNPLTYESIAYGVYAGTMLAAVMNIFLSVNEVMTDDKISYLLGNAAPYLALVFSLTLKFIPQFAEYIGESKSAQCAADGEKKSNRLKKLKSEMTVISSAVTRSIEHSAESAMSMKSRGFATGKRTYFSIYRFTSRDISALIFFVMCILYISIVSAKGTLSFSYFPTVAETKWDFEALSAIAVSFALFIFPCYTEVKEEIRWKLSH